MRYKLAALAIAFIATGAWTTEAETPNSISIKARKLQRLIENRTEDACAMLTAPNGDSILTINPAQKMIPASIAKVPLMLAAFDYLKSEFKFKTEFFVDDQLNLIIKGYGDPLFISEEITTAARKLKAIGYNQFKSITIDEDYFSNEMGDHLGNTDNPYDAANGALVVNFNTIAVGRDADGKLYSPEPQTPLAPLAKELAASLPKGKTKRYNIGYKSEINEVFKKQIIIELFARESIYVLGEPGQNYSTNGFKLVLRHHGTNSLLGIAKGLMKYSNNFIANQVMMVMGAEAINPPATLAKGRATFMKILGEYYPEYEGEYGFIEGSGLSRENFVTCRFMDAVLKDYKKYHDTLPLQDGTYFKTGTLNGVNNLAGYIVRGNRLYPFVLILYTYDNLRMNFMGIMENLVDEYEKTL